MSTEYVTPGQGFQKQKWSRTNSLFYCSHTLSAWGDRMWQFGVGMFLVTLDPTSLRLTAIYGFASGGAILFLGAIIGDWVDKQPRLQVVRTSLLLQNICVVLSAIGVFFWLLYEDIVMTTWNGWLNTLLQVLIVFFAVVADVASVGRTIAIERDWIVVICKDTETLTEMSAFLRSIDLTTNLLAPIITGQVMTYGSMLIGAIFIAAWNVVFFGIEFGLLYAVYKSVPELAVKNVVPTDQHEVTEKSPLLSSTKEKSSSYGADDNKKNKNEQSTKDSRIEVPEEKSSNVCMLFFETFVTLYRGWKTYAKQDIVFAGIALSFLYMTVLGFDNITTGYAKEQGLSESIISILLAAGALVGVGGTFLFPYFRKWIGLHRTGLVAFTIEFFCLSLCVISVFVPGSPFDPFFLANGGGDLVKCQTINGTDIETPFDLLTTPIDCIPATPEEPQSFVSIILLMTGIVSSRLGLWLSDLTVTQLLLETPKEGERGIINGVQSSLNKLMDIIKYLLVIFLPQPQMFGYLVILSFAFILAAVILYAVYSRQVRGHLFHFEQYGDDMQKRKQAEAPETRFSETVMPE